MLLNCCWLPSVQCASAIFANYSSQSNFCRNVLRLVPIPIEYTDKDHCTVNLRRTIINKRQIHLKNLMGGLEASLNQNALQTITKTQIDNSFTNND